MWLQASGSSAQQIAAALEETDRNPELRNLLHLQKAEKLTVSGLVVLKVFSNTVFLPSLKPLLKKKKVILSSCYLREKKKKKVVNTRQQLLFTFPSLQILNLAIVESQMVKHLTSFSNLFWGSV